MTATAAAAAETQIHDLPDVILSNIIFLISDTRSRNAAAIVCHKWLLLERNTRTSLTLRGNVRDLFMIPTCFRSVTNLDLSLLSPWGHPFLSSPPSLSSSNDLQQQHHHLIPHFLRRAFPFVTSLTVYARTSTVIQLLASQWLNLTSVKLIRWHQRCPSQPPGSDLQALLQSCTSVLSLDLSTFYCWTDDVLPALESNQMVANRITRLNLLNLSFAEGFKSQELKAITSACPNLNEFLAACMFDPRFSDFVGDDAMLAISSNCSKLRLLHLVDTSTVSNAAAAGADLDEEGYASEDARIGFGALVKFFSYLPLIEELVLDIGMNVRDSGVALEVIRSRCPRLRALKLGQFHGICLASGSQLDGIALCERLESLSLKNCADLNDMGLIAISRGCSRLANFEVIACNKITGRGIRTMACILRESLVEVKISFCKNLNAASSLQALEPIAERIQRLHIDCVWDGLEMDESRGQVRDFDLNDLGESEGTGIMNFVGYNVEAEARMRKKCKYSMEGECSSMQINGNWFWCKTWKRLRYLSLWIAVGELLTPLAMVGLENCPNLEEICIQVEGDCRESPKPSMPAFGLSSLARYPRLSKMQLDCGETLGYALTAPSGLMDLSLWERFYLNGIGNLNLNELDYWPPQDRDVNQRSLSLPGAGLLAECVTLRKLFIHGTAHEHFMRFLLRIPNLRDVQLREDYYPAPEDDMSTEMRPDSCSRFEYALNGRIIVD
ncbi:COI1, F-box [Dillenia turbinata]|uniref:COI1, F-box n=1 Tax=Dillenia turbinata TaxID=194707 RepID=A0AAN8USB9_9MAGN